MQAGRMVCVRMTQFHGDQFIPFQIDYISFELLRDHQLVWNLARKSWPPRAVERLRRGVLAHHLNGVACCRHLRVRESLEKSSNSEPMVAMTVCNVDGHQVFAF